MTEVRDVIQRITIFVLIPAITHGHLSWISYKSVTDVDAATSKGPDRRGQRETPISISGIRNDEEGNDVYHNYLYYLPII